MTQLKELNSVVARGRMRADELEPKLIAILIGVFDEAADYAANSFEERASSLSAAVNLKRLCLTARIRTKTDPVRLAVIENVARTSVEGVGLAWDVTHPMIDEALSRSASQITNISRTTQADVMKVIRLAYAEGLSVKDTAKLIRKTIKGTSQARAELIARTELVGAVNAGSQAAAKLVEKANRTTYWKVWLTAPGAKHPRHEGYAFLNEQTVKLNEYFQVGAAYLEFPGDPMGDPGEVCNCRCAMVYTDKRPLLASATHDAVTSVPGSADSLPQAEPSPAPPPGSDPFLEAFIAENDAALKAEGEEATLVPEVPPEIPPEIPEVPRKRLGRLLKRTRARSLAASAPWPMPAGEEILPVDCEEPSVPRGLREPAVDVPAASSAPEADALTQIPMSDALAAAQPLADLGRIDQRALLRQLEQLPKPNPFERRALDLLYSAPVGKIKAVVTPKGNLRSMMFYDVGADEITVTTLDTIRWLPYGVRLIDAIAAEGRDLGIRVVLPEDIAAGGAKHAMSLGFKLDARSRLVLEPGDVILRPTRKPRVVEAKTKKPPTPRFKGRRVEYSTDTRVASLQRQYDSNSGRDWTGGTYSGPGWVNLPEEQIRAQSRRRAIIEDTPETGAAALEVEANGAELSAVVIDRTWDTFAAILDELDATGKGTWGAKRRFMELGKAQYSPDSFMKQMQSEWSFFPAAVKDRYGGSFVGLRRHVLVQTLDEIRGVGGGSARWEITPGRGTGGKREAKAAMDQVREMMPTDWLNASGNGSQVRIQVTPNRGSYLHQPYQNSWSEMKISERYAPGAPTGPGKEYVTVTAHEFGHWAEHNVPDIAVLERAFYESRTHGETAVKLKDKLGGGYDNYEVAKEDKFVHLYIGKEYGDAFEILSMGFEDVLYDSVGTWDRDPGFRNFILGLLAVV